MLLFFEPSSPAATYEICHLPVLSRDTCRSLVTNMDTFPQGATAGGFRAAAGAWGVRYASATDPAKASSAALILPVSLLRELDDGYLMASTALREAAPRQGGSSAGWVGADTTTGA